MSFPINPTNGQQATVNGVTYVYVAPPGVWNLVGSPGTFSTDISANSLSLTAGAVIGTTLTTPNLTVTSTATMSNAALAVSSLSAATVSASGNISGANINAAGLSLSGNIISAVNTTANVTSGNIQTPGIVTASGNVTGGNIISGGQVTAAGAMVGASLSTAGIISASGNVTGGTFLTAGLISATGQITGSQFNGSGAGLNALAAANISGTVANATYAASAGTAATVTTAAQPAITSTGVLTSVSVSGNIQGGNLRTAGLVSAAGSVTGTGIASGAKVQLTFAGGGNTTDSISMLELQDSGSPSIPSIAFHRPGAYATKISLNTDNLFYFGGWSAGSGAAGMVSGTHLPGATNSYDLGSTAARWRNIYTQDLHLNNGIGDYTVVEGEEDLFLYNNKSGKVFKFALVEVDPATAPAKAKVEK